MDQMVTSEVLGRLRLNGVGTALARDAPTWAKCGTLTLADFRASLAFVDPRNILHAYMHTQQSRSAAQLLKCCTMQGTELRWTCNQNGYVMPSCSIKVGTVVTSHHVNNQARRLKADCYCSCSMQVVNAHTLHPRCMCTWLETS
jgi:hypothetical protein